MPDTVKTVEQHAAHFAGQCLCGAVRYEVHGPTRPVILLPLRYVPSKHRSLRSI